MNELFLKKLIHDFVVHPLRHYMPVDVWQPLHDWHSKQVFGTLPREPKCKHCGDSRPDLRWCKHCTPPAEGDTPQSDKEV